MYRFLIKLSIISALSVPGLISAQLNFSAPDNFSVEVRPQNPAPGEKISLTAVSYSTDLNRAEISWFLGKNLASSGKGKTTFEFSAGKAGSVSEVTVFIKTAEGGTITKDIVIHPAGVDLVWEADSYTPPFYRGKALYPYQGLVKVIAMPQIAGGNGLPINPKELVYTWKKDGEGTSNSSGYGKNIFYFNGGVPLRASAVEVIVSSLDKKYSASAEIEIKPQSPFVGLYENNPLYGLLLNKEISRGFNLTNEEVKVSAIPYFFGVKRRKSFDLEYAWSMNNKSVSGQMENDVIFRQNNENGGETGISLEIRNNEKIFQFANALIPVYFSGVRAESAGAFPQ